MILIAFDCAFLGGLLLTWIRSMRETRRRRRPATCARSAHRTSFPLLPGEFARPLSVCSFHWNASPWALMGRAWRPAFPGERCCGRPVRRAETEEPVKILVWLEEEGIWQWVWARRVRGSVFRLQNGEEVFAEWMELDEGPCLVVVGAA